MILGSPRLLENDLNYRLEASRAISIITKDSLALQVEAIIPDCPCLQTKLLVSEGSWLGWMNFREHLW